MKIKGFSTFKVRNIANVVCFTLGLGVLAACNDDSSSADTTAPTVTLLGDAEVTLTTGDSYNDAGALARDNIDFVVATTPDTVNPDLEGVYVLTYTATDAAGNVSNSVVRTVTVLDLDVDGPVITVTGGDIAVEIGGTYTELGATAIDNRDPTSTVTISGTVDTSTVGTYFISYESVDSLLNSSVAVRRVNVVDSTIADIEAPVISLIGDTIFEVAIGGTYVEPGATATDNVDVSFNVTSVGAVDETTLGSYPITYSVTDAAGNNAVDVVRNVKVIFGQSPVITLVGENTITHLVDRPYREFGATAMDGEDGELTVGAPTGTIDESLAGTYTLTYSVTDSDGNVTEFDRTFKVVDPIDARPFVFTIDTRIIEAPNGTALTPETDFTLSDSATATFAYDFTVDWGDNNIDSNVSDRGITHTYDTPGIYTVSVSGAFHHFNSSDKGKVTSIQQWGDIEWSTFLSAFQNSGEFIQWPTDIPDFTKFTVTNGLQNTFNGSLFNNDVSLWDVSGSTSLFGTFRSAPNFNQDISKWDVSGVGNFRHMFRDATLFNQDLSNWETTAGTNMRNMFDNSSLSPANYDAYIVSMLEQAIAINKTGVLLGANNVSYTSVGEAAATYLTNDYGWTIGGSLVE